MSAKNYTKFLLCLLAITISKLCQSQTIIHYNNWTGASGCNIFSDPNNASNTIAVPAVINGSNGNVAHYTLIGQPTYDNTNKRVDLVSEIPSGSGPKGTEYRMTVNFKQGFSYRITITAARTNTSQTGPNVLLRTDLNSGGGGGNNQCNGTGVIDANGSGNLKQSIGVGNSGFTSSDTNYVFNYGALQAAQTYLLIAAIPPSGSQYQTIHIRRIKIEETGTAELVLSPTSLATTCGTSVTQTFTVSNPNNVTGITSYEWNLGSSSNGWLYNGSAAPQNISTTANSITLTSVCGSTPSNVVVTVRVNNQNYKTYTATVSSTTPNLFINGSTDFCSGTSTYSINNLPCNASVTWSASPSGIVSLSCTSCPSTTLTKITDGTVTLTANISSACTGNITRTATIAVGFPYFTFPIDGTDFAVPGGQYYFTQMLPYPSPPATYNWQVSSGWQVLSGGDGAIAFIQAGSTGGFIDVAVTACGLTRLNSKYVEIGPGGDDPARIAPGGGKSPYTLKATPNPANNNVTLTLVSTNAKTKDNSYYIQEVRISDKMGSVKKQLKFSGRQLSQTINISELRKDTYVASVYDGHYWQNIKLIVQ